MKSNFLAIVLTLSITPGAYSRVTQPMRVDGMSKSADVIIKGEVLNVGSEGKADPQGIEDEKTTKFLKSSVLNGESADIRVDKVLKGANPGTTAKVRYFSAPNQSFVGLKKGEYVLLFLKRRKGALYLLDVENGKLPAAKADSSGAASGNSGDALTDEMRQMAKDKDSETAVAGISGIISVKDKGALQLLRGMKSDSRPKVRASALTARIALDDDDAGTELVNKLGELNTPSPTSAEDPQIYIGTIDTLARGKHPGKVKMIMDLANHKNEFVRRQAIHNLRELKSPESVSALAKFLDDPDFRVQYTGVITLCEIARPGGRGCPSGVRYERDQEKIRAEWKAWAAAHPDGKP